MGYIPKLDENIYIWNPWHGCRMCSIGCEHCYLYINDRQYGKDPEKVYKALGQFKLPLSTQRGKKKDPVTNRCDVQSFCASPPIHAVLFLALPHLFKSVCQR